MSFFPVVYPQSYFGLVPNGFFGSWGGECTGTFKKQTLNSQVIDQNDYFGHGVVLSGNKLFIGASRYPGTSLTFFDMGAVERYTRPTADDAFVFDALLYNNTENHASAYSRGLAYDPTTGTLMGGSPDLSPGKVSVFTDDGDTFDEDITPGGLIVTPGARFGEEIDVIGVHALIGATQADGGLGVVEYWENVAGTWTFRQEFQSAQTGGVQAFGGGIAMTDNATAYISRIGDAVGANTTSNFSVEKWTRTGAVWSLDSQWVYSETSIGGGSGALVKISVSGSKIACGRYINDDGANNAGKVVILALSTGAFIEEIVHAGEDDNFGWGVSLDGDEFVAGLHFFDHGAETNAGQAQLWDFCTGAP